MRLLPEMHFSALSISRAFYRIHAAALAAPAAAEHLFIIELRLQMLRFSEPIPHSRAASRQLKTRLLQNEFSMHGLISYADASQAAVVIGLANILRRARMRHA